MNIELVIKPCPWCKVTPDIYMPVEEETWCWEIRCLNRECSVNPKSKYVSIRKTTKKNFLAFHNKLEDMVRGWNRGNPYKAVYKKLVDISSLKELCAGAMSICKLDPYFALINPEC